MEFCLICPQTWESLQAMPLTNGGGPSLRIAVADADPSQCRCYEEGLVALGHQVHATRTGRHLVELCAVARPDLIITDSRLPDLDGLQAVEAICREQPLPVIVVPAPEDCVVSERGVPRDVFAWLTKPVKTLAPAIAVALSRFEQQQALERKVADLRRQLEDRKVIERAKGLAMRYTGLGEEDTYWRLRQLACDQKRRLVEVAQAVLAAGELFRDLERTTPERGHGAQGL